MSVALRNLLLLIAAATSISFCWGTGLISTWGQWYSPSIAYRRQTDALLSGHLALSSSPAEIGFDMASAQNGVEQVWGLGVPFWRLPFEALAQVFGQSAFPDRLALLLAIFIVNYVVIKTLTVRPTVKTVDEWLDCVGRHPLTFAMSALLILCPPIITICRGPFNVYEEAVVYGYYYSILLLVQTIAFSIEPTLRRYLILLFFAGFAGFIRPTALAYSLSTLVVTSYCAGISDGGGDSCFVAWDFLASAWYFSISPI